MLPDFRLVIAMTALTMLVVMKLGSDIATSLSEPVIAPAERMQMRRTVNPQTLPENPELRQSRYLAATRRLDELQRLLDLPSETVTGSTAANSSTIGPTTTGPATTAAAEVARDSAPQVVGPQVVGPQIGGPFTPAERPLVRPSAVSFAPSGEAAPHADARRGTQMAKLDTTASVAGDGVSTITVERRDQVTSDALPPATILVPLPPTPMPAPLLQAPVPDQSVEKPDTPPIVVASLPTETPDDLTVKPSLDALLTKFPLPKARPGKKAAAPAVARPKKVVVRRPAQATARKPAANSTPFNSLFGAQ